jgi:uncharacterized protein YjbI with pentapeptide repeats
MSLIKVNTFWQRYLTRSLGQVRAFAIVPDQGDEELVQLLNRGAKAWNTWRNENWHSDPRAATPNLSRAKIVGRDLSEVNLWGASLECANLSYCNLTGSNLKRANLILSNLQYAVAHKCGPHRMQTAVGRPQSEQVGRECVLAFSNLCQANLTDADLSGSFIYGISAWDVNVQGAKQSDLIIGR